MIDPKIKLVAVLGPTGSGKTDLAMVLAEQFGGEIVCADSRTIYRGMDVGTAKPTAEEQARVPHHLLDIVDPGERLSAAAYKLLAEAAIYDIAGRGKLPLLVGGSGLYADAVIFDYEFPTPADVHLREALESLNDTELQEMLGVVDADALGRVDLANRRRVIRAIETAGQPRRRKPQANENILLLGRVLNKELVRNKLRARIEKMLDKGLINEVKNLGTTYGWDDSVMEGNAYRAFKDVALGHKSVVEGIEENVRADVALYKRQLTWFKRNQQIQWIENEKDAAGLVSAILKS